MSEQLKQKHIDAYPISRVEFRSHGLRDNVTRLKSFFLNRNRIRAQREQMIEILEVVKASFDKTPIPEFFQQASGQNIEILYESHDQLGKVKTINRMYKCCVGGDLKTIGRMTFITDDSPKAIMAKNMGMKIKGESIGASFGLDTNGYHKIVFNRKTESRVLTIYPFSTQIQFNLKKVTSEDTGLTCNQLPHDILIAYFEHLIEVLRYCKHVLKDLDRPIGTPHKQGDDFFNPSIKEKKTTAPPTAIDSMIDTLLGNPPSMSEVRAEAADEMPMAPSIDTPEPAFMPHPPPRPFPGNDGDQ